MKYVFPLAQQQYLLRRKMKRIMKGAIKMMNAMGPELMIASDVSYPTDSKWMSTASLASAYNVA